MKSVSSLRSLICNFSGHCSAGAEVCVRDKKVPYSILDHNIPTLVIRLARLFGKGLVC